MTDNIVNFPTNNDDDVHEDHKCDECGCDTFNVVFLSNVEVLLVCTECDEICVIEELF